MIFALDLLDNQAQVTKFISHKVYKTPWRGDPRVNIQNDKGKAKVYQVRQVLKAIKRLEIENGN